MISLIGALIIIIFLFCLNLYAIGRIRKLEILNMNYVKKLNNLEEIKNIDEDKLDELAIESMNKSIFNDPNKNDCGCDTAYYYGFVAGYRKAMEE